MAGWNGSGVFSKTYSWVQDQLNGIKIRADRHDANDTDFVNGINNCLTKDGQNSPTANLPMNTYKHTGVGKATALDQYATAEQIIDNELIYYVASGTDTYTITPSPAITSYAAGQSFFVNFTNANTGAATININSLGAKTLAKGVSTALASGDIAAGSIKQIVYDGTRFQVKDISSSVASGSITPAMLANADFGDFTVSGGVATIDNNAITTAKVNNDAITYAKIQNVSAASRIIGRGGAAGSGDAEELSISSDLTLAATILGVNTGTSANQIVKLNGSAQLPAVDGSLLTGITAGFTVGTPVATTSGTSVQYTGIPSTAKQIIITFNGVSTTGTSVPMIQLGDSGGLENSGYSQLGGYGTSTLTSTTGFTVSDTWTASNLLYGSIILTKYGSLTWGAMGVFAFTGDNKVTYCAGIKTLSATLDRVGITTVGGTNTFDAGEFNVNYI